jgi:hypothetical protein
MRLQPSYQVVIEGWLAKVTQLLHVQIDIGWGA